MRKYFISGVLFLLTAGGAVLSQPEMPDDEPLIEEAPVEEPPVEEPLVEEKDESRGTLLPRPDEDLEASNWVKSLGGLRPQRFSVKDGALINIVFSPKGDRFFYFRRTENDNTESFELYTVGKGRSELRIAKTGGDDTPPLFLSDDRIAYLTRLHDSNEDGVVDILDEPTLMVSGLDGNRNRQVMLLYPNDVPVASWKNGKAILLATQSGESVNGMIVSLDLASGQREDVVEGFNVELVLPEDKLLILRKQASKDEGQKRSWFSIRRELPEEPRAEPLATLLDHSEHLIYDPANGTVTSLHRPSRGAQVVVFGGGSYFGQQEVDDKATSGKRSRLIATIGQNADSEILIIDDAKHKNTKRPKGRLSYSVIGYVQNRGPLIVESGNLGARLLLQDQSLTNHVVFSFGLFAQGFQVSSDGKYIGWVEIEDTNKNGYLEPWLDNAQPYIAEIR